MDNYRDLSIKRMVCVIGIQKAMTKQIQIWEGNRHTALLWICLPRQCSPWVKNKNFLNKPRKIGCKN